ncbi:hypothetical protein SDC9_150880 [bioreactor metagenome]|uniref:Uncharacterized protein n=1 Tax=bioreactor metagenome TaxID=1076179 RepID=A0A645ER76_9ZZZZ
MQLTSGEIKTLNKVLNKVNFLMSVMANFSQNGTNCAHKGVNILLNEAISVPIGKAIANPVSISEPEMIV